jgi:hypothetical protein
MLLSIAASIAALYNVVSPLIAIPPCLSAALAPLVHDSAVWDRHSPPPPVVQRRPCSLRARQADIGHHRAGDTTVSPRSVASVGQRAHPLSQVEQPGHRAAARAPQNRTDHRAGDRAVPDELRCRSLGLA